MLYQLKKKVNMFVIQLVQKKMNSNMNRISSRSKLKLYKKKYNSKKAQLFFYLFSKYIIEFKNSIS